MSPLPDEACDRLRDAAVRLDAALGHAPEGMYEEVSEAAKLVAGVRNRLALQRRNDPAAAGGDELGRLNALLSLLSAGEYPVVGVHAERIEQVRDALRDMID